MFALVTSISYALPYDTELQIDHVPEVNVFGFGRARGDRGKYSNRRGSLRAIPASKSPRHSAPGVSYCPAADNRRVCRRLAGIPVGTNYSGVRTTRRSVMRSADDRLLPWFVRVTSTSLFLQMFADFRRMGDGEGGGLERGGPQQF